MAPMMMMMMMPRHGCDYENGPLTINTHDQECTDGEACSVMLLVVMMVLEGVEVVVMMMVMMVLI